MTFTAYNPATRKFTEKPVINTDSLAPLVTGAADAAITRGQHAIDDMQLRVREYKKQVAEFEKKLVETTKDLAKYEKQKDPEKIKVEIAKKVEKLECFKHGMIEEIRESEGSIFVTTSPLYFYKGTKLNNMDTLEKDLLIGRFLIRITPRYWDRDIRAAVEMTNMDQREEGRLPHPCVSGTRICFGNAETPVRNLLKEGKIMELIDYLIDFIHSPNDEQGHSRWVRFFENAKPVKLTVRPGTPWVQWQDGLTSEPLRIRRPSLTNTVIDQLMKLLDMAQNDHQGIANDNDNVYTREEIREEITRRREANSAAVEMAELRQRLRTDAYRRPRELLRLLTGRQIRAMIRLGEENSSNQHRVVHEDGTFVHWDDLRSEYNDRQGHDNLNISVSPEEREHIEKVKTEFFNNLARVRNQPDAGPEQMTIDQNPTIINGTHARRALEDMAASMYTSDLTD